MWRNQQCGNAGNSEFISGYGDDMCLFAGNIQLSRSLNGIKKVDGIRKMAEKFFRILNDAGFTLDKVKRSNIAGERFCRNSQL